MKDSVDNPPTPPPTSNIWTNKIKGALNLKMGKKNAMENGLPDASKKVCLCSPTTHAGSFKCRLHRLDATQKSSSGHRTSTTQSFDLGRIPSEGGKVDDQPQLSRFGRDAATTAEAQLPATLQQFEHFK